MHGKNKKKRHGESGSKGAKRTKKEHDADRDEARLAANHTDERPGRGILAQVDFRSLKKNGNVLTERMLLSRSSATRDASRVKRQRRNNSYNNCRNR